MIPATLPRHPKALCIVLQYEPSLTETFIRAHIERLPAKVIVVHGWRPQIGSERVLPFRSLVYHKVLRMFGAGLEREKTAAYVRVLRKHPVDAVLAEYGDTAVHVMEACRRVGVPLIAHFHGYDASLRSTLEQNAETYPRMFAQAAGIVAVSRAMREQLIALGAPPSKVHLNPYGVDCSAFSLAQPGTARPTFVAIGRLIDKKSPHLTITAFAKMLPRAPDSTLRVIGDGPLMARCQELVQTLGISHAVTLLGAQPHERVAQELREARCFVQHSVMAPSGDSEGTPVSVIEASATGLPIIATRHAGIPDVVVEGVTGFLVDEGDVDGMAEHMAHLANDAELAGKMGAAGRQRALEEFSMDRSLQRLWCIIESCIDGPDFGQPVVTRHAHVNN